MAKSPANDQQDGDPELPKPDAASQRTTDFTPDLASQPTLRNAVTDTPLPHTLGRYRVQQILGVGGFGTVYLGHDTQLDRPVALKVLRGGPNVSPQDAERFLQEARRVARLQHAGIVTVHDVGIHEGRIYIVSAYIDGVSLRQWLASNRPSWQEAARITAAVADALAHAHAQLTVHRDIKPGNILLTADRTPVLVDFGLGMDESEAGGRELGLVLGTPAYMSPEQVSGAAHRIDGRTDIYGLGVVLYEMLCGRVPFRASARVEVMRQVRDDEPQPPRQLVGTIPPDLERICLKALAKRMQDRYSTAADFAEDLRRLVQAGAQSGPASSLQSVTGAAPLSVDETPSSQRRRDAERRQVTVLVCGCKLFESEPFLEGLDVEEQARFLRMFQQACQQVVQRFGGTLVPATEGGVLVCFGYPVAYEDAAQRAARTGLGILEAMQPLSQEFRPLELQPWVGMHTGWAILATDVDTISLVGEARTVAVQLEAHAEPNQVLCTGGTHRLIQGFFECTAAGSRKLKGLARPVDLFRVEGISAARTALDVAGPDRMTPLTGRDHEVNLLIDRWEQAREGMGQVVLVIGEAGLGKSRLVHTLKQHVQQEAGGASDAAAAAASPLVEWRCSPHWQNSGLFPVSDFFERLLGFGRHEAADAKFGRLVRHLEAHSLARSDVVALLAALLSLPLDERFTPLHLAPIRQKEETLRVIQEWLRAYASRRPILFVVEDLHWIDASTLELLGLFIAEGLQDRVLTLLTFRPEFKTPWPAVGHQTTLALNRLTRRQVGEMMERKTAGGSLPRALIDHVFDRTGGVPLFVEEITKMVQESGTLEQAGDDSMHMRALLAREIPATLQDLVTARLDRLAGNREVAQLAATLGREFSHELLAAVAPLDEPTLRAEVAKLVQAELLYQKGRPPKCTYLFKHALLEDAAYQSLVKSKRQQFHQRIAEVMEAQFTDIVATQPELLAHHCTEAGLIDKAIPYWLQAGLRSRQRSQDVEAIAYLNRGLALVGTLAESPERAALELQLQTPLGTALLATRGYAAPEVGPVFRRARALCDQVGQPAQRFAVMWGTWAWHVVRGDFRLCMELAGAAMELAAHLDDPGITMEALFMPGLTLLYRGDFAGARDHCQRALADFDDRERTRFWASHTGQNSGVTLRCYLSLALWHLGYPDQALRVNGEAVALARQLDHPFTLAFALHHTAWLYHHCRLGRETQAAGEEAIRIGAEQGFAIWHATGTLYRAAGLLLTGQGREGLPALLKGLDAYRATGAGLALPFYLGILGDAYLQSGQTTAAHQALNEGLAIAAKNEDLFQEAELQRLQGEVLRAESPDGGEACFARAIQTARRQQSRAWELRATMSLARLWRSQGRADDARPALAAVHSAWTEGWTTPDLVEAAQLL